MISVRALFVLVCLTFYSEPILAKHEKTPAPERETVIRPFTKTPALTAKRFYQAPLFPAPSPQNRTLFGDHARNYYGLELGVTAAQLAGGSIAFFFPYPYDDIGIGQVQAVGPIEDHDINVRFTIAGTLDLEVSDMFSVVGKLGYRVLGSSGIDDDSTFECFAEATHQAGQASFLEHYSLTLGLISLDLLGRFQFIKDGFYGLAGFGLGGIVTSSATVSQEIVSGNLCQYTYSSSRFNLTGQFVSEDDNHDLSDDINNFRFDLRAGLGTFIPLDRYGMVLVPEVTVGIPLTPFLSEETAANPDQLSLPYASLTVGIKIPWDYFDRVREVDVDDLNDLDDPEARRMRKFTETGKIDLSGRVLDKDNQPVDDASITVVDLSTNRVIATDKTEGNGEYSIEVNAPGRYSVTADAPGYLFGSTYYELDSEGRLLKSSGDIHLSRSADGRVRLLVFFDFDKAVLQPSSYPDLDRAAALMQANPSMHVEIAGYTDSQGADTYNKDLSQRRANSVLDYLVRKGVEKARITAIGYGEANPVADNATEIGRSENRRVEFVVRRR